MDLMKGLVMVVGLFAATSASAVGIDPRCEHLAGQRPADYDEQRQGDFLQNYYALSASFSGVHGPMPHKSGKGMIGVRLAGLPPLPCHRRFALNWTKTEDTNKSPVLPTFIASYAFSDIKGVVPYVEGGFLAPIPFAGTRNLVFQAAIGAGGEVVEHFQVGVRAHASVIRTVGVIATPIEEGDPEFMDLFLGSTLGVQALVGYEVKSVTPYAMVGLIDASTYFFVGDSSLVVNNLHPYLGPEFAAGVDALVAKDRLRLGAEYYGAPGGHRTLSYSGEGGRDPGFGRYGRLHTVRLRIGVEL
jgi:hypothetical protein